ncbi:alternate-type signal peptide domain-containing protein [Gordonia amicalis]|uniref:alternate-type signal peptide domain-containing protein n=1 Tax=Gordonia amicalis TaxID=89053 RepID=UPI0029532295|nr:alternate-type signal peptide domain-containing protein [Gordonia amicalis]MDV7100248.1 alternate-type signal peptide domain-containing protein [Gordonia amicalis]
MNRKTKGAIAVGAGAILLLGGMGSYALWSDQEDIGEADITTGQFGLICDAGTWTDESAAVLGGTSVDPALDRMVPGDVWEYTTQCDATATGKNMQAWLWVSGIGPTNNPVPDWITIETEVNSGALNAPLIFANSTLIDIPVTVRVTFDELTPGTTATNQTISVGGMKLSLNQVRPGGTPPGA